MCHDESFREIIGINDEKQLEVIFSLDKKLIVEAPAGYGKTSTLVNKIGYLIYSNQINWPKKVLALSFSINAAHKLKTDLFNKLPPLGNKKSISNLSQMLKVNNYHGFARGVLKLYGYLLHPNLTNITKFKNLDDGQHKNLGEFASSLDISEILRMTRFNLAVKNVEQQYLSDHMYDYNSILLTKLIPFNAITFNGILTICLQLFADFKEILQFYQTMYSVILIDEFQDTNHLSLALVERFVNDNNKAYFFGDSLQKIYGFIGAVPDVLRIVEQRYSINQISLETNYRFSSNQAMLLLDKNLRLNALNPGKVAIKNNSVIDFELLENQDAEAVHIIQKVKYLQKEDSDATIAILVKQRGFNVERIIDEFKNSGVDYFYALFTDESEEYSSFHSNCLTCLNELLDEQPKTISKVFLENFRNRLKSKFPVESEITKSMYALLNLFLKKLSTEYKSMPFEEKKGFIQDLLQYNGLKHFLGGVKSSVIISTVHAAKGLEWDYVILPDMEESSFPNYSGLCKYCDCQTNCNLIVKPNIEAKFLEELSVFYVAVTRARRQIFFTASEIGLDFYGREVNRNTSCLLKLPGIVYN